jgi:hypothetical protein
VGEMLCVCVCFWGVGGRGREREEGEGGGRGGRACGGSGGAGGGGRGAHVRACTRRSICPLLPKVNTSPRTRLKNPSLPEMEHVSRRY